MIPSYDIFKVENGERVCWIESAEDLESAKERVKALSQSSPGEYMIFSHQSGEKISLPERPKRTIFQVGYEQTQADARANLLRRLGYEVISVPDNESAKAALQFMGRKIDLFLIGHMAPDPVRNEMVAWLKENYPRVKVVALSPSASHDISGADYNVIPNGKDEWVSFVIAVAN